MTLTWLGIPALVLFLGAAPAKPAESVAQVQAQVDAADHGGHNDQALAAIDAAWAKDVRSVDLSYSAACFAARLQKTDDAFGWLKRAVDQGYDDAAWLAKDTDLVSLQKDPRMKGISEGARANKEKKLAAEHPADAKLQHELLARVAEDQQARAAMVASQMKDPKASAAMKAVDTRNTAWMKTVIAAHGWPGVTLVGRTAAQGAWLLVQHADLDPAFQERCLPLLAKAVKAHEADGKNLAYLTDRVRLAAGKPQVYGTQFEPRAGKWVPKTLEDPAHVDARRKSVGLGTLAEYAEQMLHMYGPAPKGPPPTQKAPDAKKAAPGK